MYSEFSAHSVGIVSLAILEQSVAIFNFSDKHVDDKHSKDLHSTTNQNLFYAQMVF